MLGGGDVPLGPIEDQKRAQPGSGEGQAAGEAHMVGTEYVGILPYKRVQQVKTLAVKPDALSSTPGTQTVEEGSRHLHGINTPTKTHMHAPTKKCN